MIVSISPATVSAGRKADRRNGRHIKGYGVQSTVVLPASGGEIEFTDARFAIGAGQRFGIWLRVVHVSSGTAGSECFCDAYKLISDPEPEPATVPPPPEDVEVHAAPAKAGEPLQTSSLSSGSPLLRAPCAGAERRWPGTRRLGIPVEIGRCHIDSRPDHTVQISGYRPSVRQMRDLRPAQAMLAPSEPPCSTCNCCLVNPRSTARFTQMPKHLPVEPVIGFPVYDYGADSVIRKAHAWLAQAEDRASC